MSCHYLHANYEVDDLVGGSAWSAIEVQIPMVTICFPSIRQLFIHLFGRKPKKSTSNLNANTAAAKSPGQYWYSENATNITASKNGGNEIQCLRPEELVLNDVGGILTKDMDTNVTNFTDKKQPATSQIRMGSVGDSIRTASDDELSRKRSV